jgi:hypothetical protein
MPNPLQNAGAQSEKPPKFAPLWSNRMVTGIWLQRSPLRDPSTRVESLYYGGRPEALIAGVNIELTNALTLARRPGTTPYSLQTTNEAVNSFYSFKSFTTLSETIQVMMDGLTQIYTVTPAAVTSIYTKSIGAGAASMLGINNTLFIGDGIDQRAWPAFPANSATVTSTVLAGGVATYTAVNTFAVNSLITVRGTTNGGGIFDVTNQPITAASGTSFSVSISQADVALSPDSGTATIDQTRNWGISTGGITLTSAYAGAGTTGSSGGVATNQSESPTVGTNGGVGPSGSESWSSTQNITAPDGNYATSDLSTSAGDPGPDGTSYINATGFNFNIPSGSTINGVAATAYVGSFPVTGFIHGGVSTDSIQLLKAGVQSGTGHSGGSWTQGSITPQSYGSSSDLWGTSLTASDVNNSGFGVSIAAVMPGPGGSLGRAMTAAVDYVFVTVYYTTPVLPSWTNPGNIVSSPDNNYATATPTGNTQTAALIASSYGLSVSGTVVGVQVNITGHVSAATGSTIIYAQLQDNNGNAMGAQKLQLVRNTNDAVLTFGGTSDVWSNANITSAVVASSSFGVQIVVSGTGQTFSIDSVQINIYSSSVSASVSGSGGSFSATVGYGYVYEYSNSTAAAPPFSSATPPTTSTGAFTNKLNVGLSVVASTDPQVNSIWVFRTTDGGATYYALPTNPYPNATTTITDNAADSTLNTFQIADLVGLNTPPPAGIAGMTFHMGRMWGFVNNVLYYAVGGDLGNILGSPYEGWPPANFFTFPSKVTKLIPTSVGLLVFTISDIYIVYGNASATAAATGVSGLSVFYAAPFITGIGLLSQFAADVNGTTIYMMTADGQVLSLDPSSGVSEIGFPIGTPNVAYPNDPSLASFNPANAHVAWHVSGSQDKALYVADGSTGWFRCNTSQAPEGGFVWSPKANIVGGCDAVFSIETSPGVHQLLMGPTGPKQLSNPLLSFPIGPAPAGSVPAGTYYFVVTALDEFGNQTSPSNEVSAGAAGGTGIALTYQGDSRASSYRVWIGTSPGGENAYFTTTNLSQFTVTTLSGTTPGTLPVTNSTNVNGGILFRDVTTSVDWSNSYPANMTMGNIVLAYPGQIAEIDFITCDYNKVGTSPSVLVLMDEINGVFTDISGYVHSDPPSLYGTTLSPDTLYANRYDFAQNIAGNAPPPLYCRHLQIMIDFGSTDTVKNELMTMTIYGASHNER